MVVHDGNQNYDFEAGGIGDASGAKSLQDAGEAKTFKEERLWRQRVTGTVDIGPDNSLSNPRITWTDLN
ncbi:hypothetical protein [Magnetospira sp. QH-2]|uniref:hypothetical protein n=1 Tax=Magnetospira sp. (strain QH-2) TaxID=1288970 RepID=UPI0011DD7B21|nr:hypothetical protein [Magnetospira sp. QH-2]